MGLINGTVKGRTLFNFYQKEKGLDFKDGWAFLWENQVKAFIKIGKPCFITEYDGVICGWIKENYIPLERQI